MHILIGLAAALALLYFWLLGHWFARVLVFLLFAVVGFAAGVAIVNSNHPNEVAALIVGLSLAAVAWPLASIPTYSLRRRGG